MRLDKYLKVSRIIKRRSVANEACDKGHVYINDKLAKPSTEVHVGDIITIRFGERKTMAKITEISDIATKSNAAGMYELLSGEEVL